MSRGSPPGSTGSEGSFPGGRGPVGDFLLKAGVVVVLVAVAAFGAKEAVDKVGSKFGGGSPSAGSGHEPVVATTTHAPHPATGTGNNKSGKPKVTPAPTHTRPAGGNTTTFHIDFAKLRAGETATSQAILLNQSLGAMSLNGFETVTASGNQAKTLETQAIASAGSDPENQAWAACGSAMGSLSVQKTIGVKKTGDIADDLYFITNPSGGDNSPDDLARNAVTLCKSATDTAAGAGKRVTFVTG